MTPFEQAIADLGTTPEQVSTTLRAKGIKGYLRSACRCPIAEYLNSCGFPFVSIATEANRYEMMGQDSANESIPLPKGVKEWIRSFDDGMYSEFNVQTS